MFSPMLDSVKHGSVLEHIGKQHKQNFGASQINLVNLALDAIGICHNRVLYVKIHHIFGFKQKASNELAFLGLHCDNGTFGIVQENNGNTHTIVSHDRHARYYSSPMPRLITIYHCPTLPRVVNRRMDRNKEK